MKVMIAYPPIPSEKGVALLAQNRQFQWFNNPTYIYPVIPAYAATLLKTKGYDVIWSDGISEEWTVEEFKKHFMQEKPDVIAIESKTPTIKRYWKWIDELKAMLPSTQIVLYGDHATAMPNESMENCKTDYVLTGGDYDFLLLNICNHIKTKRQFDNKEITADKIEAIEPGIWSRINGQIVNTGKFVQDHNVPNLPIIDRDLTKWQLYSEKNGNYKALPGTYTMVGRDCWWHKCTFCSWTTTYPKFQTRKPESLLDEVGMLIEKYGIREIFDDTGTFPAGGWLKKFCNGMIERGYNKKLYFGCNMRFGAVDFNMYKLMRKANFRFVLFGLESANQKSQDLLQKGNTREEIIKSCSEASKAGLDPHITVMFGYPWETYEDAMETVKLGRYLLRKGYAKTMQATIVVPYPGTPLFDQCRENGWLKTEDWDEFDMRGTVMKVPMGEDKLQEAVQQLYKVAFHPEFIFRRIFSIRSADDMQFFYRGVKYILGHLMDFSPRLNKKIKQKEQVSVSV